jgi:hypothetical protein
MSLDGSAASPPRKKRFSPPPANVTVAPTDDTGRGRVFVVRALWLKAFGEMLDVHLFQTPLLVVREALGWNRDFPWTAR